MEMKPSQSRQQSTYGNETLWERPKIITVMLLACFLAVYSQPSTMIFLNFFLHKTDKTVILFILIKIFLLPLTVNPP